MTWWLFVKWVLTINAVLLCLRHPIQSLNQGWSCSPWSFWSDRECLNCLDLWYFSVLHHNMVWFWGLKNSNRSKGVLLWTIMYSAERKSEVWGLFQGLGNFSRDSRSGIRLGNKHVSVLEAYTWLLSLVRAHRCILRPGSPGRCKVPSTRNHAWGIFTWKNQPTSHRTNVQTRLREVMIHSQWKEKSSNGTGLCRHGSSNALGEVMQSLSENWVPACILEKNSKSPKTNPKFGAEKVCNFVWWVHLQNAVEINFQWHTTLTSTQCHFWCAFLLCNFCNLWHFLKWNSHWQWIFQVTAFSIAFAQLFGTFWLFWQCDFVFLQNSSWTPLFEHNPHTFRCKMAHCKKQWVALTWVVLFCHGKSPNNSRSLCHCLILPSNCTAPFKKIWRWAILNASMQWNKSHAFLCSVWWWSTKTQIQNLPKHGQKAIAKIQTGHEASAQLLKKPGLSSNPFDCICEKLTQKHIDKDKWHTFALLPNWTNQTWQMPC